MKTLADNMEVFILGALGLTYLIGLLLILSRPARWRTAVWAWQIIGFALTSFVMGWIGLMKPLLDSLTLALGGAGLGALAAWRWVAMGTEALVLSRERRRRTQGSAR